MAQGVGMFSFWRALDGRARLGLGLGALLCAGLAAGLIYWSTRDTYEVLFSRLAESDAAAIVAQLKRQKVEYDLADAGTTIRVPAQRVHETRLGLMASGVPLTGGVGFELFDRQGLGTTEQSQRVSYQRALQGELTRTIGALEQVQSARVHLVLPESSLFRRDRQEPRAAVTLALKPGRETTREQIAGVQRLVAASVAGLDPGRVVITDQRGVTLSGGDALGGRAAGSEARLGTKREIEDYFTRKVVNLLEGAYGPGQAIVSVDVTLNFDEIRRTIRNGMPQAGAPADFDRRVEEVIAAPGGITRMSIGVIVPGTLDAERQRRIVNLVRVAAGIDEARGDAVVVQPLDDIGVADAGPKPGPASLPVEPAAAAGSPRASVAGAFGLRPAAAWLALGAAVLLVILLHLLSARRGMRSPRALTPQARQKLLADMRRALGEVPAAADTRGKQ